METEAHDNDCQINNDVTLTDDIHQMNHDESADKKQKKPINVKKDKSGILYLSFIPKGMTVQKVRQIFSEYGDVQRIFLQPEKEIEKGKKKRVNFVEGWIQITKKRVAKRIAATLNGTQIGGKRKHPFYDSIWSIKYLRKFKWNHLTEQITYEKALKDQRLRFEIGQSKKELNFYENMIRLNKKRNMRNHHDADHDQKFNIKYKQRVTDEVINNDKITNDVDMDLLENIFT